MSGRGERSLVDWEDRWIRDFRVNNVLFRLGLGFWGDSGLVAAGGVLVDIGACSYSHKHNQPS